MQSKNRTQFEVISDVLYLDGDVLHPGDLLFPIQLGSRILDLLALQMIRPIENVNYVGFRSSLKPAA